MTDTHTQNAAPSFDEVFSEHYSQLLGWCRKHLNPAVADPEDAVHLMYLRCRDRWNASYRSSHSDRSFMLRALLWTVYDLARQHARRRRRDRDSSRNSFAVSSPLKSLIALEGIDSLTATQRRLCVGILAGNSLDQLKDELQLTQAALAVHLCRAKAVLCRNLGQTK